MSTNTNTSMMRRRSRGVIAALRSDGLAMTRPGAPVRVVEMDGLTVQRSAIAALLRGQEEGRRGVI